MDKRIAHSMKRLIASGVALMLVIATEPLQAGPQDNQQPATGSAWKFSVFLDNKEIGFHNFYLAEAGETRQLKSIARFEYNLLFVRLFHYEHDHSEIWNGNCLQSINSRTDSNGEPFRVDGRRSEGEFRVSTNDGEESLPECIMSFAYWNASFLEQATLLNTQDGEFLKVTVTEPVAEVLEIREEQIPANRYQLTAGTLKLKLWYSEEGEWLALESEVRGGKTLRYVLTEGTVLQARSSRQNLALARSDTIADSAGWRN